MVAARRPVDIGQSPPLRGPHPLRRAPYPSVHDHGLMPVELAMETARGLAAAIRRREVSAAEVVDAHLERIAARNPALNAIVTLDPEGALHAAAAADAA